MGLLDLPPELLDLIIDFTLPSGFEGFVLSCKAVYGRSSSQIERHNTLKRKWRCTTNANPLQYEDTLGIIYEISRDPIIALYIESLFLWDRRRRESIRPGGGYHDYLHDDQAMDNIRSLLYSAENLTLADPGGWWERIVDEHRIERGEDGDILYTTIALLSLLPNLKTLQLPDRWYEVGVDVDLRLSVDMLVSISRKDGCCSKALSTLETVLPFAEEGYETSFGLQCIQPFMVLESIRDLYVVSCMAINDHWDGIQFDWPNLSLKSPLTRVEFAFCNMDASALAVLLSNTPALTVFRYSHQSKNDDLDFDDIEFDWNPGEFLETIANYCGDQLLELAITIDCVSGEIENGLSSFLRFPRLQKLEVDVEAFCGPPVESGQRLGNDSTVPEGAKLWELLDIPCMGDMLPDSICELQVNTDFPRPGEDALRALFKNIRDRRMDKLLLLSTAILRQYQSSTAKDIADNHGLIFEVFDEGGAEHRSKSMMPQWKRQFDLLVGGIVMADV